MENCLQWIGIGCVAGAVLVWFAAAKNYLHIRSEFSRAVRSGERMPDSGAGRGPPFRLMFQANALPQIEEPRRRLARNFATLLCLCVVATTVAAANCAQPATSMNEPWFWLLTLAVIAFLVSGGQDITLPIRRPLGYVAIAIGAAMAFAHLYVFSLYTTTLPRLPQPATGNFIPLNDHGWLVFISPWQSTLLMWLQFGSVVVALCGAVIVRYARQPEARNSNMEKSPRLLCTASCQPVSDPQNLQ